MSQHKLDANQHESNTNQQESNMSQHESKTSQHESDTRQHESTQVKECPRWVNTSPTQLTWVNWRLVFSQN